LSRAARKGVAHWAARRTLCEAPSKGEARFRGSKLVSSIDNAVMANVNAISDDQDTNCPYCHELVLK